MNAIDVFIDVLDTTMLIASSVLFVRFLLKSKQEHDQEKFLNKIDYVSIVGAWQTEDATSVGIEFKYETDIRTVILDTGFVYFKDKIIAPQGIVRYRDFDNRTHRNDGPAVIRSEGSNEYWLNGEQLDSFEFFAITGKL